VTQAAAAQAALLAGRASTCRRRPLGAFRAGECVRACMRVCVYADSLKLRIPLEQQGSVWSSASRLPPPSPSRRSSLFHEHTLRAAAQGSSAGVRQGLEQWRLYGELVDEKSQCVYACTRVCMRVCLYADSLKEGGGIYGELVEKGGPPLDLNIYIYIYIYIYIERERERERERKGPGTWGARRTGPPRARGRPATAARRRGRCIYNMLTHYILHCSEASRSLRPRRTGPQYHTKKNIYIHASCMYYTAIYIYYCS
jgi:hypothetical protein